MGFSEETKKLMIEKGKETRNATKERRLNQDIKVYTLKVDRSKITPHQYTTLNGLFKEYRYYYNYILNWLDNKEEEKNINTFSYKTTEITIKRKDEIIPYTIQFLPAKLRQSVIDEIKNAIKALSASKKKGRKVGRLRYKKANDANCINFSQKSTENLLYDFDIVPVGQNYKVYLLGFGRGKGTFFVSGTKQLPEVYEVCGNLKVVRIGEDYYIKLTVAVPKEENNRTKDTIGIDFGIKTNIVTSEGKSYNVCFSEDKRLKKLQRKLARQEKGSHNWYKTKNMINKKYFEISNKRLDKAHKIVYTLKQHKNVVMQDENLQGWHKGLFGKQVQNSSLGEIKKLLKNDKNTIIVARFETTTQVCSSCGKVKAKEDKLTLADRTFTCECGYSEDRDINAAKSILKIGLHK